MSATSTPPGSATLPAPRALFGRDAQLASLRAAFLPGTLTAVVGPPGVGKTTLAAALVAGHTGRVWVDLGGAITAADLGAVLGRALALTLARPEDVHARVVAALGSREAAVVIDAAEHLDADAWRALERLVRALPNTAWLATSVVHPPVARVFELDRLAGDEARALLIARARERALGQAPDPADPVWAALAERLDGLPLALELAAGRFGVLTAAQILERLDRPTLLAGGRHGTFTGALRYAWDLLSTADRDALARCCVFRGGFDLAAAEAVLGDDALDRLTALRERSALAWRDGRFYVYDGLRRFAEAEGAAVLADAAARHRAYYAALGSTLRAAEQGPAWAEASARLLREQANFAAAWISAREADLPVAADVALAILACLYEYGPFWQIEQLADAPAVGRALGDGRGARLLAAYAGLRCDLGTLNADTEPLLDEAVAMAEAAGDAAALASALTERGLAHRLRNEPERSREVQERAAAVAPTPYLAGVALNRLAVLHATRKRRAESEVASRAALDRFEACGSTRMISIVRHNLGFALAQERRYAEALPLLESVPSRPRAVQASWNLALFHLAQGQTTLARPHVRDAEESALALGSATSRAQALILQGLTCWMEGDRDAARGAFADAIARCPVEDTLRGGLARVWASALDGGEGLPRALEAARSGGSDAELLAILEAVAAGAPLPPVPRAETLASQIARRLFARTDPTLKVEGDGRWFERPSGRVDLARRGALRRILAALVGARQARPGAGLDVDQLFDAGWPGEAAQPEAAAGRVYTAIRELRALGLDVALRRHADGYLLDPDVDLAIVT